MTRKCRRGIDRVVDPTKAGLEAPGGGVRGNRTQQTRKGVVVRLHDSQVSPPASARDRDRVFHPDTFAA